MSTTPKQECFPIIDKKDTLADIYKTPDDVDQPVAASGIKKGIDLAFASHKADQTLRQKSEEVDAALKTEFQNTIQCMQLKQSIQREKIDCSQLTTRSPNDLESQQKPPFNVGSICTSKNTFQRGRRVLEGMGGHQRKPLKGEEEFSRVWVD